MICYYYTCFSDFKSYKNLKRVYFGNLERMGNLAAVFDS